jgi:hypothetical protein
MKTYIFVPLLTLLAIFGLVAVALIPMQSQALSCLDPASMVEYYVSEPNYIVFTATAGDIKEFVKEKAAAGDPNTQYDSGYSSQFVEVSEVHKGGVANSLWVYFQKDGTWGYLCSGGPAQDGTEMLYIINQSDGMFALPQVVNLYEADSDMAKNILKALAADEEAGEPYLDTVSKDDWLSRLKNELKEMAFVIEIKLAEWKFWLTK